jgi:hypothetical protein
MLADAEFSSTGPMTAPPKSKTAKTKESEMASHCGLRLVTTFNRGEGAAAFSASGKGFGSRAVASRP